MNNIEKDLLTVESGIICHQVNCKSAMNSGIAKQIREKWPMVYDKYLQISKKVEHDWQLLGKIQLVRINDNLRVCNMFSQYTFGYDGQRYTEYSAFQQCLERIKNNLIEIGKRPVYFPYRIGSDRGGASWDIISQMIDTIVDDAIICKMPEKG